MRQNALFQLATGLGTPGTARKEDFSIANVSAAGSRVQTEERNDHFVVRNGVRCAGVHLIVDLYEAERLDNLDHIEDALRRAVARRCDPAAHQSDTSAARRRPGVAGAAQSHISIQTCPRTDAALEVFSAQRGSDA